MAAGVAPPMTEYIAALREALVMFRAIRKKNAKFTAFKTRVRRKGKIMTVSNKDCPEHLRKSFLFLISNLMPCGPRISAFAAADRRFQPGEAHSLPVGARVRPPQGRTGSASDAGNIG